MVGPHAVVACFSHMDMHSTACLLHGISHHFQAIIRNSEWSVASNSGFTENFLSIGPSSVHFLSKSDVLVDTILNFSHATVSVCDFEACGSSDSNLLHTFCYSGKGAFDVAGGGMMVNAACGSAGDCIKGADKG